MTAVIPRRTLVVSEDLTSPRSARGEVGVGAKRRLRV